MAPPWDPGEKSTGTMFAPLLAFSKLKPCWSTNLRFCVPPGEVSITSLEPEGRPPPDPCVFLRFFATTGVAAAAELELELPPALLSLLADMPLFFALRDTSWCWCQELRNFGLLLAKQKLKGLSLEKLSEVNKNHRKITTRVCCS